MAAQDRVRWDQIYRNYGSKPFPPADPLLFEYIPPPTTPDARALDFACGFGQNGLWLAAQGYTVDLMDISRVALARARGEMAMRNLRNVNLLQVDVDDVQLEADRYAVVAVFRYLRRDLLPLLAYTIAPGGRIVYETYNLNYLDVVPGFNIEFLLYSNELPEAFPDWQIIHHEQLEHITQFVAVKPK